MGKCLTEMTSYFTIIVECLVGLHCNHYSNCKIENQIKNTIINERPFGCFIQFVTNKEIDKMPGAAH